MLDPAQKLFASLIVDGKQLATLFREAKYRPSTDTEKLKDINAKVKNLIPQILHDLNVQFSASFPEKVIPKILENVKSTLQKFKELDPENASDYEKLIKDVNDSKSEKQKHLAIASSSVVPQQTDTPTTVSTPLAGSDSDPSQQDQFRRLSAKEKKCLFCFCLFPAGKEVKEREPIHLWAGMGLIAEPLKAAVMLDTLVDEGFIENTIANKKKLNRYKMSQRVHYMVEKEMNIQFSKETTFSIMDQNQQQQQEPTASQQQQDQPTVSQQQQHQQEPSTASQQQQEQPTVSQQLQAIQEQPTASQQHQQKQEQPPLPQQQQSPSQQPATKNPLVKGISFLRRNSTTSNKEDQGGINVSGTLVLNLTENSLKATTFEKISKMKNNLKALHLGSCFHDSKTYIVVEEVEATLKALMRHFGQISCLSLQGISGIVNLPDSVYKLDNLIVLDLRGCPNLESLSNGIESLKNLTHLDLSECYLLEHIPVGIASLHNLIVLRGFVINPEGGPHEENGKRDRNQRKTFPSASFTQLKTLTKLIKLTIRTRRLNFPTNIDFETLGAMNNLTNLKIAWVWNSTDVPSANGSGQFPPSLKKLELQATPENTMLRLVKLIGNDRNNCLQKLYVRGGRFWDLGTEMHYYFHHVHTVRLRHLPELRMDWGEFRKCFPNLTQLEVFGCVNLMFLPCDENGLWDDRNIEV